MSAVPSSRRAAHVEHPKAPGADATRDLFERFAGQIYGYCLHQLGSREEAEDAVQTTFMNAFRGLQRGIVPKIESAWLFKIAHNVCLSRRRSTWRRGRVEAPNNMEVLQEVVPAREQAGDELMRLQDVLEKMPDSQRRAILLREWQGLSYREIADELGLSQSAVETLIFRARRALAAGLEEAPQEPVARGWRKRARHGFDAGSLIAALKALLTTGTVVKVAATAAVVATTVAATSTTAHQHARARASHSAPKAPVAAVHASAPAAESHSAAPALQLSRPVTRAGTPRSSRPALALHHATHPAVTAPTSAAPTPTSAPAPSVPAPSSEQPSIATKAAPPQSHRDDHGAVPSAPRTTAGAKQNPGKANGHDHGAQHGHTAQPPAAQAAPTDPAPPIPDTGRNMPPQPQNDTSGDGGG